MPVYVALTKAMCLRSKPSGSARHQLQRVQPTIFETKLPAFAQCQLTDAASNQCNKPYMREESLSAPFPRDQKISQ